MGGGFTDLVALSSGASEGGEEPEALLESEIGEVEMVGRKIEGHVRSTWTIDLYPSNSFTRLGVWAGPI